MPVDLDVMRRRYRPKAGAATLVRGLRVWLAATLLIGAASLGGATWGAAAAQGKAAAVDAPRQLHFPSAEQAVEELLAAVRADRLESLGRILGPQGAKLIRSGDPVADREGRERFVTAYDQAHRLEYQKRDHAVLYVGKEDWPLPIPLVSVGGTWRFDTKAGEQEILNRRVGRNELHVIETCRAYVEAQREYARLQAAAGAQAEYAQHFLSHPGQHDGLYWPVNAGEAESPLGPLVAQARAEGYGTEPRTGKRRPYYGYYYRILRRQGTHAPGGARDYLVGGRMIGGFGLLAYPARYGDSGVMTFIVDQDGIVFQKNLGPRTAAIARAMEQYDPDSSWTTP
jgi:Protein of unknown function (DUF2950)